MACTQGHDRQRAKLTDGALWLHFTRSSDGLGEHPTVPVLDRGEGCYVWDQDGKRYLDGLSAPLCVQVGYARPELPAAAEAQMRKLPFATNWAIAHQPALDLVQALGERFPGPLRRFFFCNSGSEAVEAALKLARQYHLAHGEPLRRKVLSRSYAYHGSTLGALGVKGLPSIAAPFEPLAPGHVRIPNTNPHRPQHPDPAAAIGLQIEMEGPETVSAVVLEPVQNGGGCFPPSDDYFQRVRQICDRYGVLLVSDEVICAFGRLGTWTGAERYGFVPDLLAFAKGVTSGYAPMGGVAFTDRIADALSQPPTYDQAVGEAQKRMAA